MYDRPLVYDIAFGYRDYRSEADLLLAWYARAAGRAGRLPASSLELAAGPAGHTVELAARGVRAAALDLSGAMCEYALGKAKRRGVAIDVFRADMIEFALERRFDLAMTMISSLGHVYTIDDMVRHLRSVARHLEPGGVYVVELPHPGDLFDRGAPATTAWREAGDGVEVEMRLGRESDPFDPISQVRDLTVEIRVRDGGGDVATYIERIRLKQWTATEFEAAVKLAGAFEIAERHGDFAIDAPFDASPASWRMIVVLRKVDGP